MGGAQLSYNLTSLVTLQYHKFSIQFTLDRGFTPKMTHFPCLQGAPRVHYIILFISQMIVLVWQKIDVLFVP